MTKAKGSTRLKNQALPSSPGWRNWQTQRTQNPPVLSTLGVQLPLPAPTSKPRRTRARVIGNSLQILSRSRRQDWAGDGKRAQLGATRAIRQPILQAAKDQGQMIRGCIRHEGISDPPVRTRHPASPARAPHSHTSTTRPLASQLASAQPALRAWGIRNARPDMRSARG